MKKDNVKKIRSRIIKEASMIVIIIALGLGFGLSARYIMKANSFVKTKEASVNGDIPMASRPEINKPNFVLDGYEQTKEIVRSRYYKRYDYGNGSTWYHVTFDTDDTYFYLEGAHQQVNMGGVRCLYSDSGGVKALLWVSNNCKHKIYGNITYEQLIEVAQSLQ